MGASVSGKTSMRSIIVYVPFARSRNPLLFHFTARTTPPSSPRASARPSTSNRPTCTSYAVLSLDLWDCSFQYSYTRTERSTIFQHIRVGVLVYVFEVSAHDAANDAAHYHDYIDALQKYSPLLRSQDGYRRRRRIELCPSLYSAHDNPRRDAVQGMPSADILSHACFSLHFLPFSPRVWTDECRHSRDSWTPSSQTRPSSTTRPRPSNGQPPSLTPLPPFPTTARTSCGRPEADAVRAPSELNVEPAWVQFKGGLLYIMAAGATLQGSETYKT
jgi:hypothetical protein